MPAVLGHFSELVDMPGFVRYRKAKQAGIDTALYITWQMQALGANRNVHPFLFNQIA